MGNSDHGTTYTYTALRGLESVLMRCGVLRRYSKQAVMHLVRYGYDLTTRPKKYIWCVLLSSSSSLLLSRLELSDTQVYEP